MYYNGEGKEDKKKGREFYRMAAQRGNSEAAYCLGKMYDTEGEQKRWIEARFWYTVAASKGHPEACYLISIEAPGAGRV